MAHRTPGASTRQHLPSTCSGATRERADASPHPPLDRSSPGSSDSAGP